MRRDGGTKVIVQLISGSIRNQRHPKLYRRQFRAFAAFKQRRHAVLHVEIDRAVTNAAKQSPAEFIEVEVVGHAVFILAVFNAGALTGAVQKAAVYARAEVEGLAHVVRVGFQLQTNRGRYQAGGEAVFAERFVGKHGRHLGFARLKEVIVLQVEILPFKIDALENAEVAFVAKS